MEREEQLKLAQQLLESGVLSEESTKAIKADFPELAESEDDRIMKFLKDYTIEMIAGLESDISISVYDGVKGHDPEAEAELEKWKGVRAWLEKQKEQKPSTEETELNSIAFLEQMGYTCIPPKEQKPNIELIQRSWYMEGYTDGKFKREPMWNLVTGKGGPRYEKNEKYGQPLEQKSAIRITRSFVDGSYKFDVVDMPNPAEWSEEDRIELDVTLNAVKELETHGGNFDVSKNWLKSLPERFNLQPKAEWSEDDELMRTLIIQTLERFGGRGTTGMQIDWLKSLRPRLSDEEIKKIRSEEYTKGFNDAAFGSKQE